MGRAHHAGDSAAPWHNCRQDNSTTVRIANAESNQEGLHEHVSDRLYTQADGEDDNV